MEDLELEAENRLRASRQRRTAQAMAWMETARQEIAQHEEFRQIMATLNACEVFTTTTREEKVTLSLVSLEWREGHKNERCSFLFNEVFPLLFQGGYLGTRGVLKFRLMSKQSKESVDNCLSNTVRPLRYFRNEVNVESVEELPSCVASFVAPEKVARFNSWSRVQYSGENPFFSRYLGIGALGHMPVPFWKDNQEFWRGMESILSRWGTQIWHVGIQFDQGMSPIDVYRQLYRLLILMPNLRSMTLQDHSGGGIKPRVEAAMPRLEEDIFGPLKEEMTNCPLPNLPHLTQISYDEIIPPPIIHAALAKYNHQLEFVSGRAAPDQSMPRDSLKVFRTISNCAPPAAFEGDFGSLSHLALAYYNVGEAGAVMEIFKNVNDCCGTSARQLGLVVRNELVSIVKLSEPILKSLSLELPQLESIRLNVSRVNLKNIDFLLPCRSLKQIILKYIKKKKNKRKETDASGPAPRSASPGEVIQFTGYVNRLYESNVWKLFPDLELVSIEVTILEKGFGKGPGLAPVMRSGNKTLKGNHLLPPDSLTTAKLYNREGYLRSQLRD